MAGDTSEDFLKNNSNLPQNGIDHSKYKDTKIPKFKFILPQKQFAKRRSLLIEMVEDNVHLRSGYNLIIAFSLFIMLSLNLSEYVHNGRLSPALYLIPEKFGKLHIVFIIWLGNNCCTFMCYYCFILWSKIRQKVHDKSTFDKSCIVLLASYYGFSFYSIHFFIYHFDIPFASSMILLGDSVRFLMKVHAFVRSNAPKVLISKSEKENIKLPTFLQYSHFVYVPTAVYRDEYPRNNNVRWSFVFYRFVEILWTILCQAHLFVYVIIPLYEDVCVKPMTKVEFLVLLMQTCIPAVFLLWLIFTSTLHSTQNAVGEILDFGDRMFYADWWSSVDVKQYYKKWNWVIGDWLYTYVNKDIGEVVFPGKIGLAKLATVFISAIVHEWVVIAALGFFCPIILVLMLLSVIFLHPIFKSKSYNNYLHIFLWIMYPLGPGLIAITMFVEYFARQNLPMKTNEMFVFWNNCII